MLESLAFIDLSLQNAYNVLHATHDYIKWQAPLDIARLPYEEIFEISCEAMRITVRMTQVIAWLMLQKAVLEGELSRQDLLSEKYHVLQGNLCLERTSEAHSTLPLRLCELLKESREFYLRILRLDEGTRKQSSSPHKGTIKPLRVV
jgi:regulator of CtrA degradation